MNSAHHVRPQEDLKGRACLTVLTGQAELAAQFQDTFYFDH